MTLLVYLPRQTCFLIIVYYVVDNIRRWEANRCALELVCSIGGIFCWVFLDPPLALLHIVWISVGIVTQRLSTFGCIFMCDCACTVVYQIVSCSVSTGVLLALLSLTDSPGLSWGEGTILPWEADDVRSISHLRYGQIYALIGRVSRF